MIYKTSRVFCLLLTLAAGMPTAQSAPIPQPANNAKTTKPRKVDKTCRQGKVECDDSDPLSLNVVIPFDQKTLNSNGPIAEKMCRDGLKGKPITTCFDTLPGAPTPVPAAPSPAPHPAPPAAPHIVTPPPVAMPIITAPPIITTTVAPLTTTAAPITTTTAAPIR